MRLHLPAALGGAVATLVMVVALRPPAGLNPLAPPTPSEVELALDRPIPEVRLEDVPFDEAAATLARLAGVTIKLDRRVLDAVGIDGKLKVTVRGRGSTLGKLLDLAMSQVRTPASDVGWMTIGDTVLLTTGETCRAHAVVRCYDVTDIISDGPARRVEGSIFSPAKVVTPKDDLIRIITDTVVPESWREAGGSVGMIDYFGGRLIILQTSENHHELQALLAQLRAPSPPPEPMRPAPEVQDWHEGLKRWVSRDPAAGEAALGRRIDSLQFDRVPFDRAVAELGARAGVSVFVDRRELEAAEIPLSYPITLDVKNLTAGQTLDLIIRCLPVAERVGQTMDAEVITITTRTLAAKSTITRVYNLSNWLPSAAEFKPAPPANVYGNGPGPIFGSPPGPDFDTVSRVIVETVDPESWRENGGNVGALRWIPNAFVITQTYENQQKVRAVLNALRAGTRPLPPATRPAAAGGR